MKRQIFLTAIFNFLFLTLAFGNGKIRVVTTLTDLRYIAQQIGGDKIDASAISKGYQDPHFVDAKPSFVLDLNRSDLFVLIGLDLEIGWVPPLLETARNKNIYYGGKGYVDASKGIGLLEIPTGSVAQLRAQGDIHVYGNPHYWLDPRNGKIIAANVCTALKTARPDLAAEFERRLVIFEAKIDSAYAGWTQKMAPFKGTKIIAYHNSWPYFENAFGLEIAGFIEPKPGIPPSPAHLVSLIKKIRDEKIKAIIISPYFDDKPAQSIATRTGAKVIKFATSVESYPEVKTYFDIFDFNLNNLIAAIAQ